MINKDLFIQPVYSTTNGIVKAVISAEETDMVKITPNLGTAEEPRFLYVKYGDSNKLLTEIKHSPENLLEFTFTKKKNLLKVEDDNEGK